MTNQTMPVLFVGHGSPMNAMEDNQFSAGWTEISKKIPTPKAILCISAHWFTHGLRVNNSPKPKQIYDMYGFPEELYQITWPAPGDPELAGRVAKMTGAKVDDSWGCDHGAWSVLRRMYPKADIPFFQLSVNRDAPPEKHFALGRTLASLRDEGVLIVGSGDVVHNLSLVDWDNPGGFPWAEEFDGYVHDAILRGDYQAVVDYRKAGECAEYAFFTPDHFLPILPVLGAAQPGEKVTVFNRQCVMGALSMTSYLIGITNP
ncbi:MAG: 4,5-DOPA dioxygenase extradiol [Sphaerochaeta sp.]|nr:4,5-DOPA dioxygenase extradiol [Sphaerochaeta sp.]MCH3920131.1 4,5-DOPA dioxygenase extradiol [Sphaerochaeta sp.]MCI2045187.1 4,5-DOPA dioxygenase extradiol [Sphaerochaeta sp.]MCI2076057.1 4,5-DOPA dioxygenase extradiol [Sphaerochaeta sp.]MCI2096317.1 4,5-DOPA dioxygenase extradiol [Sphaerochaeta sp.]